MPARTRLGDVIHDLPFQYAINITFITGVDTIAGTIPIQSDAHFLCTHAMYESGLSPTAMLAQPNGGALVLISDTDQKPLQFIPVPVTSIFGTAQRPYIWPMTKLFRANGIIPFAVTGLNAAFAGIVMRFVLGGFKVPINTAPAYGL